VADVAEAAEDRRARGVHRGRQVVAGQGDVGHAVAVAGQELAGSGAGRDDQADAALAQQHRLVRIFLVRSGHRLGRETE